MKIFRSEQIKDIDKYTIKYEPIASVDLMERAAGQLFRWITDRMERTKRFLIFTGPGNNGGDGLALARMLVVERYEAEVFHIKFTEKTSPDWEANRKRLETETNTRIHYITDVEQFPVCSPGDIIIDAVFGSGLARPAEGLVKEIIKQINNATATKISIDIPSGLFGEDNSSNNYDGIVRADFTLSFQFPKLSFMFPENGKLLGEWNILPIGLHRNALESTESQYSYLGKSDIVPMIKARNRFDHKGKFGHGLLVSGSTGKMGAAVLGAGAALRTGIGLLTCHVPSSGNCILQTSVPEAMLKLDKSADHISDIGNTDTFSAVGIGPGIGTGQETQNSLYNLILECKKPMVIDADALNILSLNKGWLQELPVGSVLTPHPKEFERLAGKNDNSFTRLKRQMSFSKENKCTVVLKGANTSVSTPDGKVFFNSTGNPGMATGGSGDVLTGIILSLLAQGYTSENAAVLGVFLHGLAGDIAAGDSCFESLLASDIINKIGAAFNNIRRDKTESETFY